MGLETLALIGTIGGGILSAGGALAKGQANSDAANFNAAVDQQRAAQTLDASQADTADYIAKGARTLAAGDAARGATGVTGEGSPLMVDEDTVRAVALGAARKLQGGQVQAGRLQDDASLQKYKANADLTASYLDAGSSLLTSAGKFGGMKFGGTSGNAGAY